MAEQLEFRCYVEKDGYLWVAVCVDLSLVAQSYSKQGVVKDLGAQVLEYAEDAITGEDREFKEQLLARRLPFFQRIKYYFSFNSFKCRVNLL